MGIVEKQVIRFRPDRKIQGRAVDLGIEGDNMVRRLLFVLPEMDGAQTATLMYGGKYADMIQLTQEDGKWSVDLTAEMVGAAGEVEGYIRADGAEGEKWHSDAFRIETGDLPDVEVQIEKLYPTAVDQMLGAIAEHKAAMAVSQDLQDSLVAESESNAGRAEEAEQRAETAAQSAQTQAGLAAESASEAQSQAAAARASAITAGEQRAASEAAAIQANDSAQNAAASATSAEASKTEAGKQAANALNSANKAQLSADQAGQHEAAANWWLRTPSPGSAFGVRLVGSDGTVGGYAAHDALGLAPACTIV